jgi:hypothetical protein
LNKNVNGCAPVPFTVVEPGAGETWATVLAPETESNAPSPAIAVTARVARFENPAVEITRASGRRTVRGERCTAITRVLIRTGTPRYLMNADMRHKTEQDIRGEEEIRISNQRT